MTRPRISVDFNEMVEPDLVLLSKTDSRADASGKYVLLHEGLAVNIYEMDVGEYGQPATMVADGVVELNKSDASWASAAKWCCRIDGCGIRHEPD
ncbi:hypothetical protein VLK31_24845 [Variovorax sp. H27-G14]|uniref:hypothetical protein n=1 Tax=Variovorax sp. H27-G14 TaxID=3111914 RepID=UPI0038FCC318